MLIENIQGVTVMSKSKYALLLLVPLFDDRCRGMS